jgi:hypothetical protein
MTRSASISSYSFRRVEHLQRRTRPERVRWREIGGSPFMVSEAGIRNGRRALGASLGAIRATAIPDTAGRSRAPASQSASNKQGSRRSRGRRQPEPPQGGGPRLRAGDRSRRPSPSSVSRRALHQGCAVTGLIRTGLGVMRPMEKVPTLVTPLPPPSSGAAGVIHCVACDLQPLHLLPRLKSPRCCCRPASPGSPSRSRCRLQPLPSSKRSAALVAQPSLVASFIDWSCFCHGERQRLHPLPVCQMDCDLEVLTFTATKESEGRPWFADWRWLLVLLFLACAMGTIAYIALQSQGDEDTDGHWVAK